MAKRQLHQLRIRSAHPSRKRGGRKLVIRPDTEANSSGTGLPSTSLSEPGDSAPTTLQERPQTHDRRSLGWRWSLVWLFAVLILGGTGVIGALLLTTLPPPPDCDRISPLAPDSERLFCAELAAKSGKLDQLVAAMNLVSPWPSNHPLYLKAQRNMEEWSQAILLIARQKMNQGNLEAAVAVVRKIPVNSPLYPEAQAKITDWQQEWIRGEKIARSVESALKAQNWLTASKQAQTLSLLNIDYWRYQRLDDLMKQVEVEKQARQQLQEARDLAKSNSPIDLDQAIALAGKVNPKSFARVQAQADRNQWSRALVEIASSRFKQEDFAGVVVVLQRIPPDSSVYGEAQDWIRLSRGQYAARQEDTLAFMEALCAVRQIGKNSPLYPQAQARMSLFSSHLQDQLQLQFASTLASFNQPLTFQLAIDQAQLIGPKRPGRVKAQTLIAYWRREIQQISDRSILATARQLAQPGTIESLRAAVAEASKIDLGEPLRVEAQTAIAQWSRQIETIEDQPVLDLARTFAQKGDLFAAIQTAQQIRPGRALSSQAQAAVDEWVSQIQIAQDRPILKAAEALAEQGRLSAAIQTASQISAGRSLHQEASSAIARWQSQLDAAQAERNRATAQSAPQEKTSDNRDNREEQSVGSAPRRKRFARRNNSEEQSVESAPRRKKSDRRNYSEESIDTN